MFNEKHIVRNMELYRKITSRYFVIATSRQNIFIKIENVERKIPNVTVLLRSIEFNT